MTTSRAERPKGAELVILYSQAEEWREARVPLPSGLVSGELEISSPGLAATSWVLALIGTRSVLRKIGTLGAVWARFDSEEGVQLWLPGELAIPAGVLVQIEFSEAA